MSSFLEYIQDKLKNAELKFDLETKDVKGISGKNQPFLLSDDRIIGITTKKYNWRDFFNEETEECFYADSHFKQFIKIMEVLEISEIQIRQIEKKPICFESKYFYIYIAPKVYEEVKEVD